MYLEQSDNEIIQQNLQKATKAMFRNLQLLIYILEIEKTENQ